MSHEYKTNYQPMVTPEQMLKLKSMLEVPVSDAKIEAVKAMLQDPRINYAWRDYQELPQYHGSGVQLLQARKFA